MQVISLPTDLEEIGLHEFSRSKQNDGQWAFIFDAPSQYVIVSGQDLLLKKE
jgi:hypothetical protein